MIANSDEPELNELEISAVDPTMLQDQQQSSLIFCFGD